MIIVIFPFLLLIVFLVMIYTTSLLYQNYYTVPCLIQKINAQKSKLPVDLMSTGKRVIFYGMVRDGMPGIQKAKENLLSLSRFFEHAIFIILEDSSTDGTREFLNDWSTQDERLTIVDGDFEKAHIYSKSFKDSTKYSFDKDKGPQRIGKYVVFRNQLHATVVERAESFLPTSFVSLDLDQHLYIDEFAFWESLQLMESNKDIVVTSAHGKTSGFRFIRLYDTYAFSDENIEKRNLNIHDFKKSIYVFLLHIKAENKLDVISNFGGLCIYRNTPQFLENYYSIEGFDKNYTRCLCEHIPFHKRLKKGNENAKHLISFETYFGLI
jgi:hypothetical protein